VCDAPVDESGKKVRYEFRYDTQWYYFAVVLLCAECGADESAVRPFAEVRCEEHAKPDMFTMAFMLGVSTPRGKYVDEPARCPRCGTYKASYSVDRDGNRTGYVLCFPCGKHIPL